MRRSIILATPVAVALLLAGVLLASPIVSATADAPIWHEGDKWAMGKEADIGALAGDASDLEDILQSLGGLTLDRFDADGEAASWILFEVVDVTSTDYNLSVNFGGKLNSEIHVQVSGEMPKAGTYGFSDINSLPKEQKTIELDVQEDFAVVFDGNVIFNKTDMAVKKMGCEFKASAVVSLDGTNIPTINATGGQTKIEYSNYNIDIKFDLTLEINMVFNPALNIYDFPLDVEDEWTVESTATVSGTVDGFLDATGLPVEMEQEMFTQELADQTGIADFPIEFDKLSSTGEGANIHDGIIESYDVPVYAEMACVEKIQMTVFGHGNVDVYVIEVNGGPDRLYYSPGVQFFTSVGTDLSGIELPGGIPSGLTPEAEMQMDTVEPEQAEGGIASVATYQMQVSEDAGQSSTDSGSNFFLDPPYVGIILIVVVFLVVMIAVVLIARRK